MYIYAAQERSTYTLADHFKVCTIINSRHYQSQDVASLTSSQWWPCAWNLIIHVDVYTHRCSTHSHLTPFSDVRKLVTFLWPLQAQFDRITLTLHSDRISTPLICTCTYMKTQVLKKSYIRTQHSTQYCTYKSICVPSESSTGYVSISFDSMEHIQLKGVQIQHMQTHTYVHVHCIVNRSWIE